jgi:hypothetical protein
MQGCVKQGTGSQKRSIGCRSGCDRMALQLPVWPFHVVDGHGVCRVGHMTGIGA